MTRPAGSRASCDTNMALCRIQKAQRCDFARPSPPIQVVSVAQRKPQPVQSAFGVGSAVRTMSA